MRLTAHTDYAVRMLVMLGLNRDRLVTIEEIATRFDLPKAHLMKVAQTLARLGFVETVRGRSGGLRLKKEPSVIHIGDVARGTEPDFAWVDCFRKNGSCAIESCCRLPATLRRAQAAFLVELNTLTLEDLLRPKSALRRDLALTD